MRHQPFRSLVALPFAACALSAGLVAAPARSQVEVGGDDVRISAAGGIGDAAYGAFFAVAAINTDEGEVLVCWEGEDDVELAAQEREIFCQRLDAATGAELGDDFRVSDMGGLGNDDYAAHAPQVVYNTVDQRYLVVWWGTDDGGGLVAGEREIFGQLLAGAGAVEMGSDFRISAMGGVGNVQDAARYPAVAFNAIDDEFLVCWEGYDRVLSEIEIYCQRLDGSTGGELGADDFRVSTMGPTGAFAFDAQEPAVAWVSGANEYLIAWWGDDDTLPLVQSENEIFAQRLEGTTGSEVGADDFRVSDMGPDGTSVYGAAHPAVAYVSSTDELLVCWQGDDDTGGLVDEEDEIFCQRLDATSGAQVGANDFRVSTMGPDGSATYDAVRPRIACAAASARCLVAWYGDQLFDGELEVFVQGLDASSGSLTGEDEVRVSSMGTDGQASFHALSPIVVETRAGDGDLLVAWHGNDDAGGVAPSEHEIYIQRLRLGFLFRDSFESGDATAWSRSWPP